MSSRTYQHHCGLRFFGRIFSRMKRRMFLTDDWQSRVFVEHLSWARRQEVYSSCVSINHLLSCRSTKGIITVSARLDKDVGLGSIRTVGIGKLGVSKPGLSRRPSFVWLAERMKLTAGAEDGGFQTPRTRSSPSIWPGLHSSEAVVSGGCSFVHFLDRPRGRGRVFSVFSRRRTSVLLADSTV